MDSLPNELILKIAESLDFKALHRFKQTSRRINGIVERNDENLAKYIDLITIEGNRPEKSFITMKHRKSLKQIPLNECDANFFKKAAIRKIVFSINDLWLRLYLKNRFDLFEKIGKGTVFELDHQRGDGILIFQTSCRFSHHSTFLKILNPKMVTFRWGQNCGIKMPTECADYFQNTSLITDYNNTKRVDSLRLSISPANVHHFAEQLHLGRIEMFGSGVIVADWEMEFKGRFALLQKLSEYFTQITRIDEFLEKSENFEKKIFLFLKSYHNFVCFKLAERPRGKAIEKDFHLYNAMYLIK